MVLFNKFNEKRHNDNYLRAIRINNEQYMHNDEQQKEKDEKKKHKDLETHVYLQNLQS